MKKRIRPAATQNEPHRRNAPAPTRQLESATGGIRAHINPGGFDDPPDATLALENVSGGIRAHLIGGGFDDPADSNPDAP